MSRVYAHTHRLPEILLVFLPNAVRETGDSRSESPWAPWESTSGGGVGLRVVHRTGRRVPGKVGCSSLAETGKQVSGGGGVSLLCRRGRGSFTKHHHLGWGSLQNEHPGNLALGLGSLAPGLPRNKHSPRASPLPIRNPGVRAWTPLLLGPGRRQRSSQTETRGSPGAALFAPRCAEAVEGFWRSHSPAGRLRALGSTRACPGPLFNSMPQLAALLSSPRAI